MKEQPQKNEGQEKDVKTLEETKRQLHKCQLQLVQSEKMASLGQLAAGVAHEINNPVAFVLSNLRAFSDYMTTYRELLFQYDKLSAAVKAGNNSDCQKIMEQIDQMQKKESLQNLLDDTGQLLTECQDGMLCIKEIVEGLKSFARADDAEPKEVNINENIETTLKLVRNEIKYRCEVHKNFGEIPPVSCYPGQLNQVFANLLVNAAQAIPEKGDIFIETEATDTHVVIRISDTGVGIPPENLPKLFTPFFTTKPTGIGTGLGLAISYRIIQRHKGTIEATSREEGGTTFTIRLPFGKATNE